MPAAGPAGKSRMLELSIPQVLPAVSALAGRKAGDPAPSGAGNSSFMQLQMKNAAPPSKPTRITKRHRATARRKALLQTAKRSLRKRPWEKTDEDMDILNELFSKLPFFQQLPAAQREDLYRDITLATFCPRDPVMQQGQPGDCYYIALEGGVVVHKLVPPSDVAGSGEAPSAGSNVDVDVDEEEEEEEEAAAVLVKSPAAAGTVTKYDAVAKYGPVVVEFRKFGSGFGQDALLSSGTLRNATVIANEKGLVSAVVHASAYRAALGISDKIVSSDVKQMLGQSQSHLARFELNMLDKWLKNISFLGTLSKPMRLACCAQSYLQSYKADSVITTQGEVGRTFHIVVEGSCSVHIAKPTSLITKALKAQEDGVADAIKHFTHSSHTTAPEQMVHTFGPAVHLIKAGEGFGELALAADNCLRAASIVAREPCEIMTMSKRVFDSILVKNSQEKGLPLSFTAAKAVLDKAPDDRNSEELGRLVNATKEISFFKQIPSSMHQRLCAVMTMKHFDRASPIITQHEEGDTFYIVLKGSVSVQILFDGSSPPSREEVASVVDGGGSVNTSAFGEAVATLSSGDAFGEQALMGNGKRNASIVCREPVVVLTINKEEYDDTLKTLGSTIVYAPQACRQLLQSKVRDEASMKKMVNMLADFLSKLAFFAQLPRDMLKTIASCLQYKYIPAGSVNEEASIYKKGENTKHFYVLLSGSCSVHEPNPSGGGSPRARRQSMDHEASSPTERRGTKHGHHEKHEDDAADKLPHHDPCINILFAGDAFGMNEIGPGSVHQDRQTTVNARGAVELLMLTCAQYNTTFRRVRDRLQFQQDMQMKAIQQRNELDAVKVGMQLQACSVYNQTPPAGQDLLCKAVKIHKYEPHQPVCFQGTKGEEFFIVVSGKVTVHILTQERVTENSCTHAVTAFHAEKEARRKLHEDMVKADQEISEELQEQLANDEGTHWTSALGICVATLHAGFSFGETSILYKAPRNASIVSAADSELAVLDATIFERCGLRDLLTEKNRKDNEFLTKNPVFADLPLRTLQTVSYYFTARNINRNTIIVKQGEPSSEIFFLKIGEAKIVQEGRSIANKVTVSDQAQGKKDAQNIAPVEIAIIRAGEIFGELALCQLNTAEVSALLENDKLSASGKLKRGLLFAPQPHTVVAHEDCVVMTVPRMALFKLFPSTCLAVLRSMASSKLLRWMNRGQASLDGLKVKGVAGAPESLAATDSTGGFGLASRGMKRLALPCGSVLPEIAATARRSSLAHQERDGFEKFYNYRPKVPEFGSDILDKKWATTITRKASREPPSKVSLPAVGINTAR